MEVEVNQPVKVKLKSISVHAKIRDAGSYILRDTNENIIKEHDGYVPGFFPGEHYGDYLDLVIDIETGTILNWKKIHPETIQEFIDAK